MHRTALVLVLLLGCGGSSSNGSGGLGPGSHDGFVAVDGSAFGPATSPDSAVAHELTYSVTDASPAARVVAAWATIADAMVFHLVFEVRNEGNLPLCLTNIRVSVRDAADAEIDWGYTSVHSSMADVSYAGYDDCLGAGETAFATYPLYWSQSAVDHVVIDSVFGVQQAAAAPPAKVVATAYTATCTGSGCTVRVTARNDGTATALIDGILAGEALLIDQDGAPLAVVALRTTDFTDAALAPGAEVTLQGAVTFEGSTTHLLVHVDFDVAP